MANNEGTIYLSFSLWLYPSAPRPPSFQSIAGPLWGPTLRSPSSMFIASVGASFCQDVRAGGAANGSINGAELGSDNRVYFGNNNNPGTEQVTFWVQFDLTETTAVSVR